MSAYFFQNIPSYCMCDFVPVRSALDNFLNVLVLAEVINTCAHCLSENGQDAFDIAIFSGKFSRALVRKDNGFFSMAIPFQIIKGPLGINFNSENLQETVSGQLISIFKNAVNTSALGICYEDILSSIVEDFGIEKNRAVIYADEFFTLLSDDHGYLRFDDDKENENGDIHPRYHFDFFYKNSSSVKIGTESIVDLDCFYSLFDKALPKRYIRT